MKRWIMRCAVALSAVEYPRKQPTCSHQRIIKSLVLEAQEEVGIPSPCLAKSSIEADVLYAPARFIRKFPVAV